MYLDQKGELPILPLFVNCLGEEAGAGYPPRPTAKRCYELGVVGDKPAEIVDVLDEQSQVSFKVFSIWD